MPAAQPATHASPTPEPTRETRRVGRFVLFAFGAFLIAWCAAPFFVAWASRGYPTPWTPALAFHPEASAAAGQFGDRFGAASAFFAAIAAAAAVCAFIYEKEQLRLARGTAAEQQGLIAEQREAVKDQSEALSNIFERYQATAETMQQTAERMMRAFEASGEHFAHQLTAVVTKVDEILAKREEGLRRDDETRARLIKDQARLIKIQHNDFEAAMKHRLVEAKHLEAIERHHHRNGTLSERHHFRQHVAAYHELQIDEVEKLNRARTSLIERLRGRNPVRINRPFPDWEPSMKSEILEFAAETTTAVRALLDDHNHGPLLAKHGRRLALLVREIEQQPNAECAAYMTSILLHAIEPEARFLLYYHAATCDEHDPVARFLWKHGAFASPDFQNALPHPNDKVFLSEEARNAVRRAPSHARDA